MSFIRSPETPAEWEAYYALRWRVLREPWGQPPGSERDELDETALHFCAFAEDGAAIGAARLHFNSPEEAQVRYMAIAPEHQGKGIGAALLADAEEEARRRGAKRVALNARDNAMPFYKRQGYAIVKSMPPLYGSIAHWWMEKKFS